MRRLSTIPCTVYVALGLAFAVLGPVSAQQTGQLDTNFGSNGKMVMSWNTGHRVMDEAMAVASQADGKMVIAGRSWSMTVPNVGFCIAARTLADGSVDTTFGTNGLVTIDFGPTHSFSYCNALTIQRDGKILVTGAAHTGASDEADLAVARLNTDGSLDTSFGSGGKATFSFVSGADTLEYADEILLQSDGKIIVAASIHWPTGSDWDFLALRLLPNGTLDTAYGSAGYSVVAFDLSVSKVDRFQAAAIQADGKVVLAGFAETASQRSFAISRLDVDGRPDATFGVGGKQVIDFYPGQQTADLAHDVVIDTAQRILVVGETTPPGAQHPTFAVVRLTSSGSLDTSFSTDGRQTMAFPHPFGSRAYAVAEVANNKMVVVGDASYSPTDDDYAAARLLDNGSLDPTFGSQGLALVPFDIGGQQRDVGTDLTVQFDGGVVIVGVINTGTPTALDWDWGLTKLTGESFFSFP